MSGEEWVLRGIKRLPRSVPEAFAALEADVAAQGFLPTSLLKAYVVNKTTEFDLARGWSPDELCRRYAEIY